MIRNLAAALALWAAFGAAQAQTTVTDTFDNSQNLRLLCALLDAPRESASESAPEPMPRDAMAQETQ